MTSSSAIVVDSSALIAVLTAEPTGRALIDRLAAASRIRIGAATLVETGIVLVARIGLPGKTLLARFVEEAGVEVVPIDDRHWTVAVDAFARYGKGRHPAGLNFGDCLTYAVARLAGEPLLCLGDDFPQTDVDLVDRDV
ncbi:type II toxin-antitoxin system VapC family toxin [Microlunatus parietis]|uniref:Ribonuclease VapC n=1 Tax=Microlunatus parietis TaxID=682979 RepID=A0A7Y9I8D9_9ACTN|nr:type II toxin-antitoxin system VapC family toxin [Microlunatus parietis]NYE72213.1 ribonuclease VapC [Microlunatus parietis]